MWFGTNLKLQRQALQSISRYTTGSRTTICMYVSRTEQVASTRPTNWERCAAEKCFDREEKTRDTRHTSHEIQEG